MSHVFSSIAPILGGIAGTIIAPGIGTAIGAGLGSTVGGLASGKNIGQSLTGGLETGALAGVGGAALGALGSAAGTGGFLSGTLAGNAINAVGSGLSSLGGDITSGLGAVGNALDITGPGGLTSDISSGWSDLTGGGAGTATSGAATGALTSGAAAPSITSGAASQAITGGTVSNPALASELSNVPGNVAAPVTEAAGGVTPSISQGGGGLFGLGGGGGGGGGKGLFGGSNAMALLAAAPVALDVLRGNQQYKGQAQIGQSAAQLSAQSQQLQNYLQTGTLPPAAQASINQAVAASQASIRSQYASMGMSGSSAEAQDLANAQTAGATQAMNYAQSLFSTGLQETQMSDALYQNIMNQSMAQDNQLSSAIGSFAAAAAA
jgi:hypothetical protein